MRYPAYRPRRLRRTDALRRAFSETALAPSDLIAPLFVKEGLAEAEPIPSMPGHHQHTLDTLVKEARELAERGVAGMLLFAIPGRKDPHGSEAYNPEGIAQQGIAGLKDEVGDDAIVLADLCMCEYTDHGHCGVIEEERSARRSREEEMGSARRSREDTERQVVANDPTIEAYGRIATSQAAAGADLVAPSGMMDGQVGAIRRALDDGGFADTAILSYAVKYASSFYGPFRDAAEGAPRFGDRRSHQQDPANVSEALREAALDVEEGADALMVKPALPYLDVLRAVKDRFGYPTAAYNVSGEYSMLMAAADKGWIDERTATLEVLTSIRRAGADLIVTYHAKKAAEWLAR